jgi:hypothetical protein
MAKRVKGTPPYSIGYARPPKHKQFTPGRSGNPRGRSTGSKNLATMIIEELMQKVPIVENGKRTKIPKMRAAVRQAINGAMRGDFKALPQILNMLRSYDALKRVKTHKMVIPLINKNMSVEEASRIYAMTLAAEGDLDDAEE